MTSVEGLHPRVRCQNISSVEHNNCKICAIYTFTISCCDRQKMYAHSHYIAQSAKPRGLIDFIFVKFPNQSKGSDDEMIVPMCNRLRISLKKMCDVPNQCRSSLNFMSYCPSQFRIRG